MNALLAAGYNFRLLLRWLALFLCALVQLARLTPHRPSARPQHLQNA